jgi:small subunit ribosomal protein S1
LSWDENNEEALKEYKPGQVVKVKVLGIEAGKERISLGIKQLTEDKKSAAIGVLKKGDRVTCVVSDIKPEGIDVRINDTINTFIKRNDLSNDRIEQRSDRFAIGDKVDAKVTLIDKITGNISVSIKALEVEEQKDAIDAYGSTDSGASLGDILGAALESSNSAREEKK